MAARWLVAGRARGLVLVAALLLSVAWVPAASAQDDGEAAASEAPAAQPPAEDIEALKAQLAAAEQRAKDAESKLDQMKKAEAVKAEELSSKEQQLQAALDSQQAASKAIKDASSEKESLAQAKAEMEAKIKGLEKEKAAATADAAKVSKLENELQGLKEKLSKEQDARELVVKLRKEKEELKLQLEEERKNIYYQAKEVWIPQATESLKNLTLTAQDSATKLADQLQTSLEEAEKEVAKQLEELDKNEHVETARKTAQPVLQDARKTASGLLSQALEQAKYPITGLRQQVRSVAGEMGALAKYKEEYAKGSDYWLILGPLILCCLIAAQMWVMKGFRNFCLRVQQVMFFLWISVALCAMILKEDTAQLMSESMEPAALVAFHALHCLDYAVVGMLYATLFLSGPSRMVAAMQSAAVAWVLYNYYTVLLEPMLMSAKKGPLPVPTGFTRGHLMRAFFALILGYFGSGPKSVPQSSKPSQRKQKTQ